MKFRLPMAGCVLAAAFGAAFACGVCIDDKVAAAYDHDVVQRAVQAGRLVVFCELSGPFEARSLAPHAKKAAATLPGVDPSSIRTSNDLPVISFTIDPARQTPDTAVAALRSRLTGERIVPTLLKALPSRS
jgi:hypothetical protein